MFLIRARCTTESQSCVTDLPAQKCLSARQLPELKKTEKGTIFKNSFWAVECLQSEGVVECKYFIRKTQHVVNDDLEGICDLITFRSLKLIVTSNYVLPQICIVTIMTFHKFVLCERSSAFNLNLWERKLVLFLSDLITNPKFRVDAFNTVWYEKADSTTLTNLQEQNEFVDFFKFILAANFFVRWPGNWITYPQTKDLRWKIKKKNTKNRWMMCSRFLTRLCFKLTGTQMQYQWPNYVISLYLGPKRNNQKFRQCKFLDKDIALYKIQRRSINA